MPNSLIVLLGLWGVALAVILIQRAPSFPNRLRDRLNRWRH